MSGAANQQTSFWKSLSQLDWVALVFCVLGLLAFFDPLKGAKLASPLRWLGFFAVIYAVYRYWSRWRSELLWSLRNRLVVAYLFLAVVPIVLLLILASMLGQIVYEQLGGYLLYHDIEDRIVRLSDAATGLAAAQASLPASLGKEAREAILAEQATLILGGEYPRLRVNLDVRPEFFSQMAGPAGHSFSGMIQI